jgi:hypothetical protein
VEALKLSVQSGFAILLAADIAFARMGAFVQVNLGGWMGEHRAGLDSRNACLQHFQGAS